MPPEAFSKSSPPGLFPSAPRFRTVFVVQGSLRRIFQTGKDSPAAHKPRPGPLRAAMLSASPSVLEVQLQNPCEGKKCVFLKLKNVADDDHRMRSHAVNQLIASGALEI